jgi:hypothetical protein
MLAALQLEPTMVELEAMVHRVQRATTTKRKVKLDRDGKQVVHAVRETKLKQKCGRKTQQPPSPKEGVAKMPQSVEAPPRVRLKVKREAVALFPQRPATLEPVALVLLVPGYHL